MQNQNRGKCWKASKVEIASTWQKAIMEPTNKENYVKKETS